jgi:hypothetical protein
MASRSLPSTRTSALETYSLCAGLKTRPLTLPVPAAASAAKRRGKPRPTKETAARKTTNFFMGWGKPEYDARASCAQLIVSNERRLERS